MEEGREERGEECGKILYYARVIIAIRLIFNSLKKKNGEEKLLNSSRLVFYDNVCKKGSERGKKIRRS